MVLTVTKKDGELREYSETSHSPVECASLLKNTPTKTQNLHLMHEFEAGLVPWNPPFTIGHENVDWVDSIGAVVTTALNF